MYLLVVEDEALVALDATEALEAAGHEVGSAGTYEEGYEIAEARRPDLALIDVNLCGREDGPRLADALWSEFGVRCLFVTAQPEQAREHKEAGVGVLTKPYLPHDLVASVPVAAAVVAGVEPRTWAPRNLELFERRAAA